MEFLNFDDKNSLEIYVNGLIEKLNSKGEFNVFLHQISDMDENLRYEHGAVDSKIRAILRYKFRISNYSSLIGTTKLIGNAKNVKASDILNYEYYTGNRRAVCLIALPKYLNIDGKKTEFSSYDGISGREAPQELIRAYKENSLSVDVHHFKCSLFDAVKRYNELPNCYLIGIHDINLETGTYSFINPHTHLVDKSQDEISQHEEAMAQQVKDLYAKYNTNDRNTVIVNAFKEEEALRDAEREFQI